MAAALLIVGLMLAGAASATAEEQQIQPGMTASQVGAILGKPDGQLRTGAKTVWTYRRGMVEFIRGRVATNSLISEDELARREAERARRAAASQPAAAATIPLVASAPLTKRPAPKEAPYQCPFIRPPFDGAQYCGEVPIVFELRHWPPQLRQIFNESVEIPLSTGQRRTTYQTVIYELRKYPQEMLDKTIRCIYVIRALKGTEKDAAGFAFHTEGIVIVHSSYVHHEVAHQFAYQFPDAFPAKELQEISGEYVAFDLAQAVYFKTVWEKGFASNYGMTSVQEDFAEFCERLYLQPEYTFKLMEEYPKLKAKFAVIRPFLEMVKRRTTGDDSPMDRDYFVRFDRTRWRPDE